MTNRRFWILDFGWRIVRSAVARPSLRLSGTLLGLALAAGPAWGGRPLTIDDAGPVDPGILEVEAGGTYREDSLHRHQTLPFGLTYGLPGDLEAGVGFGGQRLEERALDGPDAVETGWLDVVLGAKWRVLGDGEGWGSMALVPAVKLPAADHDRGLGSGDTDYDLTWIASVRASDRIGVHVNAGHAWIGHPWSDREEDDLLHGGIALDVSFLENWQWVGEWVMERDADGHGESVQWWNTGLRWTCAPGLTLDAAAGGGITREAPDVVATVGLTWSIGGR